jgi:hypothetical protein
LVDGGKLSKWEGVTREGEKKKRKEERGKRKKMTKGGIGGA